MQTRTFNRAILVSLILALSSCLHAQEDLSLTTPLDAPPVASTSLAETLEMVGPTGQDLLAELQQKSPLAEYGATFADPKAPGHEFDALGANDQTPQISVEIRFIEFEEDLLDRTDSATNLIWKYSTDGPIPKLNPVATIETKSDLHSGLDTNGESAAKSELLGCSESTISANPVRLATLSLNIRDQYLLAAQQSSRCNVMQAPRVTVFSGQLANITDSAKRPFVTAVTPIHGKAGTVHQPNISLLEEGVMMRFRANADELDDSKQRLKLSCDLAFSEILDVEEFNYSTKGATAPTTVQVPKLHVRQVHLCSDLQSGQSLLIDPFIRNTSTRKENGLFGRTVTTSTRRLVLITPVWLDLSDDVAAK